MEITNKDKVITKTTVEYSDGSVDIIKGAVVSNVKVQETTTGTKQLLIDDTVTMSDKIVLNE